MPQGKTDPDAIPFQKLKGEFLVVEEKMDGSGVCLFFDHNLTLQISHRANHADGPEYRLLHEWAEQHEDELFDLLGDRYNLFGEWMYIKHNVYYDKLPCFFFESDIHDREQNIFLSTAARRRLLNNFSFIESVPILESFRPRKLQELTDLITKPLYQSNKWLDTLKQHCNNHKLSLEKIMRETDQSGLAEGLYIKHEDENKVLGRYKYVRYEFVQNILDSGTHLMDRLPIANSLAELEYIQDYWR